MSMFRKFIQGDLYSGNGGGGRVNMEGDIYLGCLLGFIFGGHIFFVGGGAYIRDVFTRF